VTQTLPEQQSLDPGWGDQALELLAQIRLSLSGQEDRAKRDEYEKQRLLQSVYRVEIPPQGGNATAAGVISLGQSDATGPRTGKVWDVRRVTVTGTGSASTEVVSLYRAAGPYSSYAVGANLLTTFSGLNPAPWSPGKGGGLLRAGEILFLYGTGLTGSETIQFNGDAIEMNAGYEGAYLL
jgi:hypothetical protein